MAAKKKAAKKTGAKRKKAKKANVPYAPNEARITNFMGCMIQAGYVGKTIPDDSGKRKKLAQSMRQMAQQLDRQVHKTVT